MVESQEQPIREVTDGVAEGAPAVGASPVVASEPAVGATAESAPVGAATVAEPAVGAASEPAAVGAAVAAAPAVAVAAAESAPVVAATAAAPAVGAAAEPAVAVAESVPSAAVAAAAEPVPAAAGGGAAGGGGGVAVGERPAERVERTERPERVERAERPARPDRPAPTGREPINMKALLEAGVHFGHQTRRWNPTMKRYIFTQRNGIHIIDLQQTLGMINDAYKDMVELVANGGKVMFVGTKRQAQDVIQSEADRCGMWYVNQRWLGGTLTNFQTIRTRISYMLELQQKRDQGYFRRLPKKEGVKMRDTLNRLEKYFTGMRDMTTLPQAIFAIDIGREDICIAEARRLGIDVFAIVDSDCNPDLVDHIIPGNDDAVRSIRLVTNRMASAVLEGLAQREAALQAEMEEMQSLSAGPETLSAREDAALSGAVTLDVDTLAELAVSMGARAAGGDAQ